MRLRRSLVVVAFALTACAGSPPAGVDHLTDLSGDVRIKGPGDLEQHLSAELDPPAMLDPNVHTVLVRSMLTNRGGSTLRVRSRVCSLTDADITSSARLDRIDALVLCGAVEMTLDLAPGESTPPIEQAFGVRSGPGTYTIGIRHALSPEFRGTITIDIP